MLGVQYASEGKVSGGCGGQAGRDDEGGQDEGRLPAGSMCMVTGSFWIRTGGNSTHGDAVAKHGEMYAFAVFEAGGGRITGVWSWWQEKRASHCSRRGSGIAEFLYQVRERRSTGGERG